MATAVQKTRALEKAYEMTKAYAGGDVKTALSTVLDDVYKKLVQLEEDSSENDQLSPDLHEKQTKNPLKNI